MKSKLIKAIQNSNEIAIISHISPDGDTCGSALALYRALTLFGKNAYLFCDDQLKSDLQFLDYSDMYNIVAPDKVYDLAISVDCASSDRLGNMLYLFKKAKISANIDHHRTNDKFGHINIIDYKASATAEIVFLIVEELNKIKPSIDNSVAKLIYSGIVTDSGGFTFSSVTSQTHLIASKLIQYDINSSEICNHFLKSISFEKFNLRNRVLSKTVFFENNRIALITFCKNDFEITNTTDNDTDGIINQILAIKGVDIAVSIAEINENSYKCSLRTNDNVDSSRIAMMFGGGGHKNASGFRTNGFFEDVKDKIIKACRDNLD